MTSCTYSKGGATGRDRRGGESRDCEAQLRLQRLEEMVTNLMQTTKGDAESRSDNTAPQIVIDDRSFNNLSPPKSDLSPGAQSNLNTSETSYANATHWTKILENVGFMRSKSSKKNS